ncbi:hypothetical protein PAPYR_10616 [Paratrimastix pyriformis]|uniref:Uncharacterized protein n=1 Tax=Paratrimastix pyriformis TaxID=342808 RepID=A0ABQ8UB97_9EUKA|nr:hypothetical protein PAPYR_10616 [Paratrimastix pyriformis]
MVDIRFRPRSGSGASQGSPNTLGALREGTLATLLRDKTIDFPAPAVGSLGVCPGAIPRGRPEGVGHHSAHLLARCAQPHAPKSARSLEAPLTSVPGGSPATPPAPPGWPGPRLPCQLFAPLLHRHDPVRVREGCNLPLILRQGLGAEGSRVRWLKEAVRSGSPPSRYIKGPWCPTQLIDQPSNLLKPIQQPFCSV